MARTHTEFVDFEKLANVNGAEWVAILTMACNDIAVANSAMGRLTKKTPRMLEHVKRGIKLYFIRMQSAHLNEALLAIEKVRKTPQLRTIVSQCNPKARDAFDSLCACLSGGVEHSKFEKYIMLVRHRVAFHYDPKDLLWAIKDRSSRNDAKISSLTAGENIHSYRFEFADDLIDTIVVRRIWKIPRNANVRKEVDKIADWGLQTCLKLWDFCADFVPRFIRRRAAA